MGVGDDTVLVEASVGSSRSENVSGLNDGRSGTVLYPVAISLAPEGCGKPRVASCSENMRRVGSSVITAYLSP